MPVNAPPSLFPAWSTPKGIIPAIYAWRAYTGSTQSVTSVGQGTSLATIPAGIVAMVYYHSLPGVLPIRATWDYGDTRPYTFHMPNGTTRVNSTSMTGQAYSNLIARLQAGTDGYPV